MRRSDCNRAAFTLVEILATLLLLVFGVASALGMVRYATRVGTEARDRVTALAAAETVLIDPSPLGATPDPGDADDDGWRGNSAVAAPATGGYRFSVEGWLNGYYLYREESSTDADIVDPTARWATIRVEVYAGGEDRYLTSLQRRLLRRTVAP